MGGQFWGYKDCLSCIRVRDNNFLNGDPQKAQIIIYPDVQKDKVTGCAEEAEWLNPPELANLNNNILLGGFYNARLGWVVWTTTSTVKAV